MSSFICEKCGAEILDTPNGYITECEHYPMELTSIDRSSQVDDIFREWIDKCQDKN